MMLPAHPEVPGLLPLGKDSDGLDIYWVTDADPGRWSILLSPPGSDYTPGGDSLAGFLLRVFGGPLQIGMYTLYVSEMPAVEFRASPG